MILNVEDTDFYTLLASEASWCCGCYIEEYWHSHDLFSLFRILSLNKDVLASFESGIASLKGLAHPIFII